MKVKVYKRETVISVAEVEVASEAQAVKYVRAVEGTPSAVQFSEQTRNTTGISLSPEIGKRAAKTDTPDGE